MKLQLKIGEQTVAVQENAVDRVVRYFDPIKANLRLQARLRGSMLGAMSSGYVGASRSDRSLSGWQTTLGSPDADSVPRERGDEPARGAHDKLNDVCSPRARG